jgi:hypothetical protein
MRDVLVNGNQNVKACFLRRSDEPTVGETLEPCEATSLAIVTCELMTKGLVDALVQQDTHSTAGEQSFFRFFKCLQCHFTADSRKPVEESLEGMASF